MKRLASAVLYMLGLPSLLRFIHSGSLTIVLYHGVAPATTSGIFNYRGKFISPASFAKQLDYFRNNYRVLPLDAALTMLKEHTLPRNALVITFDDGYANFHDYALPLLKQKRMPATVFLATDFVTRGVPLWVDRLEHACGHRTGTYEERIAYDAKTRDELKKCTPSEREARLRQNEEEAGTSFNDFSGERSLYAPLSLSQMIDAQGFDITFGAHTQSHPILSTMTADEQQLEIVGSRQDLERLGITVSQTFAYPNGHPSDWNEHTADILATAGFTRALTTIEGVNDATTPPYELRRMVLDTTEDAEKFANVVTGVRLFVNTILARNK